MSSQSRSFGMGDLHLGHALMATVRPFATIEEHDEAITTYWNETVRPQDIVYLLGDAVINRKHLHKLGRLHGRKRIVMGNHDVFRIDEYTPYFEKIVGSHGYGLHAIMTHIPIHPNQLKRFPINLHGHLHAKKVQRETTLPLDGDDPENWGGLYEDDPHYVCLSAEHTNYRPVLLDEVIHNAKTRLRL